LEGLVLSIYVFLYRRVLTWQGSVGTTSDINARGRVVKDPVQSSLE